MPMTTQVHNVVVRGLARILKLEVKELEIDGRAWNKADIVNVMQRIAALEAKVGP